MPSRPSLQQKLWHPKPNNLQYALYSLREAVRFSGTGQLAPPRASRRVRRKRWRRPRGKAGGTAGPGGGRQFSRAAAVGAVHALE
jgi:hypothetical protein